MFGSERAEQKSGEPRAESWEPWPRGRYLQLSSLQARLARQQSPKNSPQSQFPSITASASSRTFSSTPLLLRAGSGVQGGPTAFVGPFIARPLTLRTARYHGVWTKRSFVLTRDSFAASDQDSSL